MKQVIIDASAAIGLRAEEPDKVHKVIDALNQYYADKCTLHAPHLIVMEVLFILCKKQKEGKLSKEQYQKSISRLEAIMTTILPPPNGDASLIARAEAIRESYGCSHSADSVYLALAEELAQQGATELLTFDEGQAKQAMATVPQITVNLLTP